MSPEHLKLGNEFSKRALAALHNPFDPTYLHQVFHYGNEAQSESDKEALMAYSRIRSRQSLLKKQTELLADTDVHEVQQAILQRINKSVAYIESQKKVIERELAYAQKSAATASSVTTEDEHAIAAREAMHREAAAVEQQRIINPNPNSWTPFREKKAVNVRDTSVLPKNIAQTLEAPRPNDYEEAQVFYRAERKRTGSFVALKPEAAAGTATEPLVLTNEMRVDASKPEPLILTHHDRVDVPSPMPTEIGDYTEPNPEIFEPWRQVVEEEPSANEAETQPAPQVGDYTEPDPKLFEPWRQFEEQETAPAEPGTPNYEALADYASYRHEEEVVSAASAPPRTGAPKLPGVTILDAIAPPTMAGYAEAIKKRREEAAARIARVEEQRRRGIFARLFSRESSERTDRSRTTRNLGLAALIGLAALVNYKKDEQIETLGEALNAAKLQNEALIDSKLTNLKFIDILIGKMTPESLAAPSRAGGIPEDVITPAVPQGQAATVFENVFSAEAPATSTSFDSGAVTETAPVEEAALASYVMQEGDTLWDLAEGDVAEGLPVPALADLSREEMQPIIKKFEKYLADSVNLQAGLGLSNPVEGNDFTQIPTGETINLTLMNETLAKIRSGEINVTL